MTSAQEKRDQVFVAILQEIYDDKAGTKYTYGFDDIEVGENFFGMQYFIKPIDSNSSLVGFGEMATDKTVSIVLVKTLYPIPFYHLFFSPPS